MTTKRILLLGNGGREHAIAKALNRSQKYTVEIFAFMSAHNPGIAKEALCFEICTEKNFGAKGGFAELKAFAHDIQPHFAIIGPDDPIGAGAVDALRSIGIESMAPSQTCARLESSKGFTRNIVEKYGIPGNPQFQVFTSTKGLEEFCATLDGKFVVKDDGLCGGKGVFVQGDHFETIAEGLEIAKKILEKSDSLVIEEKLEGPEFSLMFFVDGKTAVPMPSIADHKRAYEGDTGPNTGGMGTISFPTILPFITEKNIAEAHQITEEVMKAVEKECGEKFHGIMYGGFMRTKNGTKLIEYNARFGDPEALNALPILESDFIDICEAIIAENLAAVPVVFRKKATVCKYLVPEGYPTKPIKGSEIIIDESKIPEGVELFFASVAEDGEKLVLCGSRAIGVVGIDEDFATAEGLAEKAMEAISGPVFHRKDIGTKALLEKRISEGERCGE
ncbi:MAG: phosphoribosylamine--glycine ligase [Candidatus Peregrinibacteria bacterium]